MRLLLIDNYDSFTYNLYQQLEQLGAEGLSQNKLNKGWVADDERIVCAPGATDQTRSTSEVSYPAFSDESARTSGLGAIECAHHCLGNFVTSLNVVVKKNDEITIGQIKRGHYDAIVISPGPKKPKDSGISCDVVREFYKTKPILGVCLGHQCIGEVFGAKVVRAPCVMHGKVSEVEHEGIGIFRNAKNPFNVARYHSLILDSTPKDFIQTAKTQDGIIMGIQHKKYPVFGVQFHPESFLTQGGDILIRNFLTLTTHHARNEVECAPLFSFGDLCPGTDL